VDVPSVGGCILLRPTQSEALHLQMIGRCLRPQPGKQAVILDHVGNIARLGHHLEERHWTLAGVRKRERVNAPSVKTCPQCFCAMASPAPRCPECGHQFRPERRSYAVVAGELQELSAEQLQQRQAREQRKREQQQASSLEELIDQVPQLPQLDRAACRRRVEQLYSTASMAEGYLRVYRSLLWPASV
jgi:superfamily II DNA or RNA helicase